MTENSHEHVIEKFSYFEAYCVKCYAMFVDVKRAPKYAKKGDKNA